MSFQVSRLAPIVVRSCRNGNPATISKLALEHYPKRGLLFAQQSQWHVSRPSRPNSSQSWTCHRHSLRLYTTTSTPAQPSLEAHNAAVQEISSKIRTFHAQGQKYRITHGSTNSTRLPSSKGPNLVDLSKLNNVIHIDTVSKTALVEPNVPMDRLVEATLIHGLVPPIVMDFPGITVGGGYAGTSGESSSFRHGFFDRTMNWIEVVLADGQVVRCSNHTNERADLFHGAAGAVGTLGTTTLAELRLDEARDYVQVTYHAVSSMEDAISKIRRFTKDPKLDYVDGIMYSLTQGAIITGYKTNTPQPGSTIRTFSAPKDPWFYLHVQEQITNTNTKTKSQTPVTEAVPLANYLFRYDRGGFWVGRMAFSYFSFPFAAWSRRWLDDFLHTRMMYTALHGGGQATQIVVQDLALPYETAGEFVEWTDKETGIWPLWLCPLKTPGGGSFHPHLTATKSEKPAENELEGKPDGEMLNIGLWGQGPRHPSAFVSLNRAIEAKVRQLGGMKWLYAHTYYPETEFWSIYGGRAWYDRLREKYKASGLPSVYDKVRVDVEKERKEAKRKWWLGVWPIGGFWGLWRAIRSKAYVDARKAAWMAVVPRHGKGGGK